MSRYLSLLSMLSLLTCPLACGRDGSTTDLRDTSQSDSADSSTQHQPNTATTKTQEEDRKPTTTPTPTAAAAKPCVAPADVSNSPTSMSEVATLINAMEKPVTLPCFLQVLRRPLYVNATSSQLSVQPAVGSALPRIFLFANDSFLMTFVPAGTGSKAIEFSTLLSDTTSVKAEISFPVTTELKSDSGYKAISSSTSPGTRCTGCHGAESVAPVEQFGPGAFISKALKPFSSGDVPIYQLEEQKRLCGSQATSPCDIFRALIGNGEVLPQNFPADMPTLF